MIITESRLPDIEIRDQSITERVFEGLVSRPDEVVMTDGPTGRTMTARDLMDGVKAFAGGLTERGHGEGRRIALMAPNMPEFFIVMHGALWAGAAVTTVNPTYTAYELNHQLKDSGAELLITAPPFLAVAKEGSRDTSVREIVVIGEAEGALSLSAVMARPIEAQVPVDLTQFAALLPYSSGTTGLPKGVMLTHRNLVANVDQGLSVATINPGEVTPAFLPFFHIYGLELLLNIYLARGANLVTMPRFDLEQFLRLIETHRAERAWVVPPVASAMAKHPMVDNFDLSSLVQVNSAAAPFGKDLGEALGARLGCAATQAYGMTELSPISHVNPLSAPRAGSVGVSVASTACRIVDTQSGEDLPAGEEGELWIKGPQVMRGYLNNPDATHEAIVEDGWLRTGDVGCFDDDGYLFIRDRIKELIKVKGFQVPPAEVEAVLMTHAAVSDVAVIGVPDEEAGEAPMAFVVAAETTPTLEELQAHLVERLAHYKQIRRVAYVDAIPKSASGKILRRLLREEVPE